MRGSTIAGLFKSGICYSSRRKHELNADSKFALRLASTPGPTPFYTHQPVADCDGLNTSADRRNPGGHLENPSQVNSNGSDLHLVDEVLSLRVQ